MIDNLISYKTFSKYYRTLIESRDHNQPMADFLYQYFPTDKELKILDAACGLGNPYFFSFPHKWEFYGNDGNKEMLHLALTNIDLKYKKLFNYKWEEISDLFNETGKFDVILFLGNSLSHVHSFPEFKKVISDTIVGLKESGYLVFDIREWIFNSELNQIIEPTRKIDFKSELVKFEENNATLSIYDRCYYSDNLQIIEYTVENNLGETIDKFEVSYLPIEKYAIEQLLLEEGCKITFYDKPTGYPYNIVVAQIQK